jgi:hypothetical protein
LQITRSILTKVLPWFSQVQEVIHIAVMAYPLPIPPFSVHEGGLGWEDDICDLGKLPTSDQQLSHGNLGLLVALIRKTPLRVVKLIGNKRYEWNSTFFIYLSYK